MCISSILSRGTRSPGFTKRIFFVFTSVMGIVQNSSLIRTCAVFGDILISEAMAFRAESLVAGVDELRAGTAHRSKRENGARVRGEREKGKGEGCGLPFPFYPFPLLPLPTTDAYLDRPCQLSARAVLSRVDSGVQRAWTQDGNLGARLCADG